MLLVSIQGNLRVIQTVPQRLKYILHYHWWIIDLWFIFVVVVHFGSSVVYFSFISSTFLLPFSILFSPEIKVSQGWQHRETASTAYWKGQCVSVSVSVCVCVSVCLCVCVCVCLSVCLSDWFASSSLFCLTKRCLLTPTCKRERIIPKPGRLTILRQRHMYVKLSRVTFIVL